jgi:integrase
MVTPTVRGGRAPRRALKSPLAAPGAPSAASPDAFDPLGLAHGHAALTDREATLAEFQGYLRTVNNRAGRPFEEKTVTAYSDPVKSREFIDDLLDVTGGGRARDFETARDHAIIRILRSEGIRRMELLGMVMHALPADVIQNPTFRLVPLKDARAAGEGRLVMLAPSTARALALYLRARRHHPLADSDWVWLGTRGRGRLQGTGIRRILIRRAEQAGYAGVTPHQFRHTFSDAWLKSGGSEGDLMRLNGWKSRAMVDRYADDVANQRALEAKRRRGDTI